MKDDSVYLHHILEAIERIQQYVLEGREGFLAETICQDAVIRNLAVIGEAVKKLSKASRAAQPAIPWRQIAGMRDVLIHDYFGIDLEQVWAAVQRDLPQLEEAIRTLLSDERPPAQRTTEAG